MAGLRFQRRKRISGVNVNLGKRGVSVSKSTRRGSIGFGRHGARLSIRIIRGLSAVFGKR